MSLTRIIRDLEEYLRQEGDEGREELEVSPAVVKELGRYEAIHRRPSAGDAPAVKPVMVSAPSSPQSNPSVAELESIAGTVSTCRKCPLHATRTRTVPGQGHASPEIMFVGEGPGADEDRQGLAFVGSAGQLLTKMIEAMGYTREEVFIGNIVKCRPPGNRKPLAEEMEACLPYLRAQIAILKPKVLVALGATALTGLLNRGEGISRLRGKWLSYEGIDLMPTYHPAFLLYDPSHKKEVWSDLQQVLKRLGRTPPPIKRSEG